MTEAAAQNCRRLFAIAIPEAGLTALGTQLREATPEKKGARWMGLKGPQPERIGD
jgi:hypothetical protein